MTLRRFAYVGYVVESSEMRNARQSRGTSETDDTDIDAILFAISDLKQKLKRFIVICDHQSYSEMSPFSVHDSVRHTSTWKNRGVWRLRSHHYHARQSLVTQYGNQVLLSSD